MDNIGNNVLTIFSLKWHSINPVIDISNLRSSPKYKFNQTPDIKLIQQAPVKHVQPEFFFFKPPKISLCQSSPFASMWSKLSSMGHKMVPAKAVQLLKQGNVGQSQRPSTMHKYMVQLLPYNGQQKKSISLSNWIFFIIIGLRSHGTSGVQKETQACFDVEPQSQRIFSFQGGLIHEGRWLINHKSIDNRGLKTKNVDRFSLCNVVNVTVSLLLQLPPTRTFK